jgi:membrane fusion protein, multidrug efflux system
MKKGLISNIIIGALACVAVFFVGKKIMSKQETAAAAPSGPPKETMISAYIVNSQNVDNEAVVNGTFVASEEVDIKSELSGKVVSVTMNEGKFVNKGTVLARLYNEDIKALIQKLEPQLKLAESSAERLRKLYAQSGTSLVELENANNLLNNIQADLRIQHLQLEKTEIKAPFSGILGFKNVSVGAYVTPAVSLTSLQQRNPIKLDFNVPEKLIDKMQLGKKIQFTTEKDAVLHTATIVALDPKIDLNSRMVKVRAQADNRSNQISPGAFAKVKVDISKKGMSLMIPTQCIIPEARNKKVMLIKNGKAKPTIVETGIRQESTIEIISGLSQGDTILATGILQVKPESAVKITGFVQ